MNAWKGPDYIENPATDQAGVDWILAENWWPYQRPTFVTPPFAGYVSGHSTYSRSAAEVLTLLTGDPYFPGGMGEFVAPKNEFLVFEEGPSMDVVLQWATYRDASDQCSLSRIWGGIHPPADDIPGRLMGLEIGPQAFEHAEQYFTGIFTSSESEPVPIVNTEPDGPGLQIYPNPAISGGRIRVVAPASDNHGTFELVDVTGRVVRRSHAGPSLLHEFDTDDLAPGLYFVRYQNDRAARLGKVILSTQTGR